MAEKTTGGYRLTNEALKGLSGLKTAVEKAVRRVTIEGRVIKGLGDGAYYMALPGYSKQIKRKLGFVPFPGTLNLRVNEKTDLENTAKLRHFLGVKINAFKTQGRFFGGATCFKILINGRVKGAAILPDRTHHDANTLEIIAPEFLRKKLKLKNGQGIRITYGVE